MQEQSVLIEEGNNAIVKGSKSFSMASFFFSPTEKQAAWLLNSWCRFVDDEIDKAATREEAQKKLLEVRSRTEAALKIPSVNRAPIAVWGFLLKIIKFPGNTL